MTRDTYTIDSPDDIGPHLRVSHLDMTGDYCIAVCFAGDRRVLVPIGIPLCSGCDEPVTDELCACQRAGRMEAA